MAIPKSSTNGIRSFQELIIVRLKTYFLVLDSPEEADQVGHKSGIKSFTVLERNNHGMALMSFHISVKNLQIIVQKSASLLVSQ